MICEISLSLFANSRYGTYKNYCESFKLAINDFANNEIKDIPHFRIISRQIEYFFGLDMSKSMSYIINYYVNEKYSIFEKVVLNTERLYPSFMNIYTQ